MILRNMFTAEEMALLTECVEEDPRGFADDGTRNRIWLWHESDLDTQDMYSGIAHCERIVSTVSRLLGEEVYLYHYKVIQKESGNADSVTAGRAGCKLSQLSFQYMCPGHRSTPPHTMGCGGRPGGGLRIFHLQWYLHHMEP